MQPAENQWIIVILTCVPRVLKYEWHQRGTFIFTPAKYGTARKDYPFA